MGIFPDRWYDGHSSSISIIGVIEFAIDFTTRAVLLSAGIFSSSSTASGRMESFPFISLVPGSTAYRPKFPSSTYLLYSHISNFRLFIFFMNVLSHHSITSLARTPVIYNPIGPPDSCLYTFKRNVITKFFFKWTYFIHLTSRFSSMWVTCKL